MVWWCPVTWPSTSLNLYDLLFTYNSYFFSTDIDLLTTLIWWVIKRKHLPRYWPFVLGIHLSVVISPHKRQWREALMFPWSAPEKNNRQAGDLRRHCAHYYVTVMKSEILRNVDHLKCLMIVFVSWCFFICTWTNGLVNNRDDGDLRLRWKEVNVSSGNDLVLSGNATLPGQMPIQIYVATWRH